VTAWSRRQIADRIDELASAHEGPAFVAAVEGFASQLDADEREVLGDVLVARARETGGLDYGLVRRITEPRWRLFGRPPPEPPRSRE
jgi:hypothetical protein